jgi:hypothetical protein
MQSGGTGTRSSGLLYEALVALAAPVAVPGHDRGRLTSGEESVEPCPRCVGGLPVAPDSSLESARRTFSRASQPRIETGRPRGFHG